MDDIHTVVCARQRKFRIPEGQIDLKGIRQGAFLEKSRNVKLGPWP